MKKYIFTFLFLSVILIAATLLAACNANTQQQSKSLSEQRAESDTILAFQGIRISEPLDSARYFALVNNRPVKLYREDKTSFAFSDVILNGACNVGYPGDVVHSLCLKGNIDKYYDFLSFICLYEESYGCFSYYQRLNQNDEKMGTFYIGKISKLNEKPWTRMDAVSDFIEHAESSLYKYIFVWEWNNQTIVLSYNPNETLQNSSVSYFDTGFAERQAEEETQKMLKDAEERDIEKARKQQQI